MYLRSKVFRTLFPNHPSTGVVVPWLGASMVAGGSLLAMYHQQDDDPSKSSSSSLSSVSSSIQSHITQTEGFFSSDNNNNNNNANRSQLFPSSFMSPTLPIRIIRPNPNLEIVFDVRTKNAIYVLEKLDRQGQNLGKDHRRPNFFEENVIEEEGYRSKLSHYKNSGYDRGHLAPAADFPSNTQDTYTLCNVSPQNHTMNLSIWSRLEDFCRKVSDRQQHQQKQKQQTNNIECDTYVVTGPLWLPLKQVAPSKFQYAYIGLGQPPSLVSVPTHFFKVIAVISRPTTTTTTTTTGSNNNNNHSTALVVQPPKIMEFACFVIPNIEPNKSKTLIDYIVPWSDLEIVTGLQFFSNIITPEWKEMADSITIQMIQKRKNSVGDQQQQPLLLLTDGSSSSSRKSKSSLLGKKNSLDSLIHLCKDGECR